MLTSDNPSRLNIVFTKSEDEIYSMRYLPPLGRSKHAVLCFTLSLYSTPEPDENTIKLNYHETDISKRRGLFSDLKWVALFTAKQHARSGIYFGHCSKIVEEYVSLYIHTLKSGTLRWMTLQQLRLIHKEKETWERYRTRKNAMR